MSQGKSRVVTVVADRFCPAGWLAGGSGPLQILWATRSNPCGRAWVSGPHPRSRVLTAVSALCVPRAVSLGQDEVFQPSKDWMSHDRTLHFLPPRPGQFLTFFLCQVAPVSLSPYKKYLSVHVDTHAYPNTILTLCTSQASVRIPTCMHNTHLCRQGIEGLCCAGTGARHELTDVVLTEPLAQRLANSKCAGNITHCAAWWAWLRPWSRAAWAWL